MSDLVNHPPHYKQSSIECIDAIEALTGNFSVPQEAYLAGCVLKYIWRCNHKGSKKQDLEKAQWYLNRLISKA